MANFKIETSDGVYSYQSPSPGQTKFPMDNNNKFADTQGFLRKKQNGQNRMRSETLIEVSRGTYENTIAPMLIYGDTVEITHERNIPLRGTNIGTFVLESAPITKAFDSDGGDDGMGEMKIVATEVITT